MSQRAQSAEVPEVPEAFLEAVRPLLAAHPPAPSLYRLTL